MIYWHNVVYVGNIELSAIRSTNDLHYSSDGKDLRAEIMWRRNGGLWQDLWCGSPYVAHEVQEWAAVQLRNGCSMDEIEDYVLEKQL
ncbi:MAG: hypothetical protein EOM21_15910 [Gammaproteobacteria bacterium]|nr:hypothetical protein [Gammaproteobacteria bacterium]